MKYSEGSLPKSKTTRIETFWRRVENATVLEFFTKIQNNKDWNLIYIFRWIQINRFFTKIQNNKDWNMSILKSRELNIVVLYQNPKQQGLKLFIAWKYNERYQVLYQNPKQQGLKRVVGTRKLCSKRAFFTKIQNNKDWNVWWIRPCK